MQVLRQILMHQRKLTFDDIRFFVSDEWKFTQGNTGPILESKDVCDFSEKG